MFWFFFPFHFQIRWFEDWAAESIRYFVCVCVRTHINAIVYHILFAPLCVHFPLHGWIYLHFYYINYVITYKFHDCIEYGLDLYGINIVCEIRTYTHTHSFIHSPICLIVRSTDKTHTHTHIPWVCIRNTIQRRKCASVSYNQTIEWVSKRLKVRKLAEWKRNCPLFT